MMALMWNDERIEQVASRIMGISGIDANAEILGRAIKREMEHMRDDCNALLLEAQTHDPNRRDSYAIEFNLCSVCGKDTDVLVIAWWDNGPQSANNICLPCLQDVFRKAAESKQRSYDRIRVSNHDPLHPLAPLPLGASHQRTPQDA